MKKTIFVKLATLLVFAVSAYAVPPDMVLVPGGEFQMGDSFNEGHSDELPVHTVTLDSFYMGKYEVTNGQYCDFLKDAAVKVVGSTAYASSDSGNSYPYCNIYPSTSYSAYSQIAYIGGVFSVVNKGGRNMSNDPIMCVSWYGAVAYCNWRSQQEGKESCYNLSTWECDFTKNGYRLPTEAEWEYAARGGLSGKRFPWGDTITHSQANYISDSSYPYDISPTRGYHPVWSSDGIPPYTSPVGSFAANGYGLYNMADNATEWCNDWYSDSYYSSSPPNNPTGPTTSTGYRIHRGGNCWHEACLCRVAGFRGGGWLYGRGGFRVASIPEPAIEALVDINPDSLNKNSKGQWVTVYITLPAGYDVAKIDANTIAITSLTGASCQPDYHQAVDLSFISQVGDRDEDGIADLTVKFSRQELIANLCLDDVTVTVEGKLVTGEKFKGIDHIRVIDRGK